MQQRTRVETPDRIGRRPGAARSRGPSAAAPGRPARPARSTARPEGSGTLPPEGAAEAVMGGEPVAIPSLRSVIGSLAAVVGQGGAVAREGARLAADTARIAAGRADFKPARGDRRFDDPTWRDNPLYSRLGQFYLAWAGTMNRLVDDMERKGADWHQVERARFATGILVSALAPTNALHSNPAAIKRAFETGGQSLVRGFQNWLHDVRHNGGMPSQSPAGAFELGRDLAVTPGAVVERDEVAELLQYRPSTERVRERPLLIVPPPIGRFYFLDLREGRSFVEYAVAQGLTTFMVSWRNPTAEHAEWDMDTYAGRILRAIDSVRAITGSDDVNVIGFCAGGILTTTVLNHLAARRDRRVHSMAYAVTLLDFGVRAPIGTFSSRAVLDLARAGSRRKGIIDARSMGTVFTWMRPDDLVFNYWVNNYLMGEPPPAFDILAWSVDGTNLPAALHRQFLDIFAYNDLCRPGHLTVLDTPVDLGRIKLPIFVTGAVTDHLTPWKGCYQTTQLLKGPSTFVLSNSGHIASLVNPPGNPRATYRSGPVPRRNPDAWLKASQEHIGSWWQVWAEWLLERSGQEVPARGDLGSGALPPLDPAPGLYVRDLMPGAPEAAQRAR